MSKKEVEKKQFVSSDEIEKLKAQTEQQLNYARQQAAFWTKKVEQLTGSLAMCRAISKKTQLEESKD